MGKMSTFLEFMKEANKKIGLIITSIDLLEIIDMINELPLSEKDKHFLQINDINKLVPYYMLKSTTQEKKHYCYVIEKKFKTYVCILFNNILYKLEHNEPYFSRSRDDPFLDITTGTKITLNGEDKSEVKKEKSVVDQLLDKLQDRTVDKKPDDKPDDNMVVINLNEDKKPETDITLIKAVVDFMTKIRKETKTTFDHAKALEIVLSFEDVTKVIISEKPNQGKVLKKIGKCFIGHGWDVNRFIGGMDAVLVESIISELYDLLYEVT
jgi:hypothetical protein